MNIPMDCRKVLLVLTGLELVSKFFMISVIYIGGSLKIKKYSKAI